MATLYSFRVNIDTLEIKAFSHEDDDPMGYYEDEELIGVADFNEDGFRDLYAESVVSAEDAERLICEKAREYRDKFAEVYKVMSVRDLKRRIN